MAPRAIGLGATQITFIVVTALATTVGVGALADFNFAFALLQIPLGIIGVPLGIVVLPTLSRDAAVGREVAFAALLTRALRLLVYVMVPIAVLTVIVRATGRRDPVRGRQHRRGGPRPDRGDAGLLPVGLTAHALIAVLARGFYARQDTVTPVLAAIAAVAINCSLAIVLVGPYGLQGIALAIAVGGLDRGPRPARDPAPSPAAFRARAGWSGSAIEAVVGSALAGAVAFLAGRLAGGRARRRSRAARPGRRGRRSSASSSGSSTPPSRSCCGSPNCRLSSGSWPTCSAAPPGRDGRRSHVLGRVRRGE